jgi:phospholipid transport system substrate-binding protein
MDAVRRDAGSKGEQEMTNAPPTLARRGFLGAAVIAAVLPVAALPASAQMDGSPAAPIERLNGALLVAMKAGSRTPFDQRYHALAPVVEQVFNLDAVLAASVGLSWGTMTPEQKTQLAASFRRYTITSYVSNFDSYEGQHFETLPTTRTLANGDVVVPTQFVRAGKSPLRLDYVMRRGPAGWQAVDVLTDGAISRVAVQRSDFRGLLRDGGVPALAAGLERKTANVSGSMG